MLPDAGSLGGGGHRQRAPVRVRNRGCTRPHGRDGDRLHNDWRLDVHGDEFRFEHLPKHDASDYDDCGNRDCCDDGYHLDDRSLVDSYDRDDCWNDADDDVDWDRNGGEETVGPASEAAPSPEASEGE
jgi:hypothetical protein